MLILKGVKWGRETVERWKVRREFDSMYTRQNITKYRYCQYQFTMLLITTKLYRRHGEEGEERRDSSLRRPTLCGSKGQEKASARSARNDNLGIGEGRPPRKAAYKERGQRADRDIGPPRRTGVPRGIRRGGGGDVCGGDCRAGSGRSGDRSPGSDTGWLSGSSEGTTPAGLFFWNDRFCHIHNTGKGENDS